ncbi:MAG: COX15/CtaA family protein [Pseudomonadota bacterium]
MSKRAIFEEVSETRRPVAAAPAEARAPWRRGIAIWLWLLALLVAVMVLIGGLTRLTDSGLSITVWDPVMGAVPPLSDADWDAAFALYQQTTEFQEQNHWMTLADFKPIYWWEWGHRQFGRLIGVVWLVGFLVFLVARRIPTGWTGRLMVPGVLGGIQGFIGWWMVASGLDKLDVASYRLATHLGLAFAIFMLLTWLALKVRLDPVELLQSRRRRAGSALGWTSAMVALVFLQLLVGALVAGIDAGRSYVDWPLMQGQWFPEDALLLEPLWRNLFESSGLVQFVHRVLGYLVALVALIAAWRLAAARVPGLGTLGAAVLTAVASQVAIGIVTVIKAAPLEWAIMHQAGALVLILVLMLARFRAAYPPATRLAA